MGISTLSLMKDATGASITGGTAMALTSDGVEVKNGVHVADAAEVDFTIRTNATFRTKNPVRQPDGSYTKAKRFCTIVVPKDLGDDGVVYNLIRIEEEIHPKTTAAEQLNIEMLGAQYFTDSDLASFRSTGSLT